MQIQSFHSMKDSHFSTKSETHETPEVRRWRNEARQCADSSENLSDKKRLWQA